MLQILLVEDLETTQHTSEWVIKEFSCEVDVVETDHEALALAKQKSYDFIFIDLYLPYVDSIALIKDFKQFYQQITLPQPKPMIIGLNLCRDETLQTQAYAVGMHDCLAKPLRWSVLCQLFISFSKKQTQKQTQLKETT